MNESPTATAKKVLTTVVRESILSVDSSRRQAQRLARQFMQTELASDHKRYREDSAFRTVAPDESASIERIYRRASRVVSKTSSGKKKRGSSKFYRQSVGGGLHTKKLAGEKQTANTQGYQTSLVYRRR